MQVTCIFSKILRKKSQHSPFLSPRVASLTKLKQSETKKMAKSLNLLISKPAMVYNSPWSQMTKTLPINWRKPLSKAVNCLQASKVWKIMPKNISLYIMLCPLRIRQAHSWEMVLSYHLKSLGMGWKLHQTICFKITVRDPRMLFKLEQETLQMLSQVSPVAPNLWSLT
jgi:hypothetical protein